MAFFFTLLINGLLVGVMYSLVALGFVVTYKATGAFNFAQGEFVMFGAIFTATALQYFGLPLPFSIAIGIGGMMLVGLAAERGIWRPLIKKGAEHIPLIMATLGLAYMLKGLNLLIWGPVVLNINLPTRTAPIIFLDMLVKPIAIVGSVISISFLAGFTFLFLKSRTGMALRAVADDNAASQLVGINVKRFIAFAWALTGLVAAIGGIVWGNMLGVDVYLSTIGLKVFPVVIMGGMTSISGTILAGLIVGATESVSAGYIDPYVGGGFKDFVPFVIIIIVLMIRPTGLFGEKDIETF